MRRFGIPDIVGDLAKDAVADHHPRAARLIVIEPNEPAVAVFRVEVRPVVREDVRVQVDLHARNVEQVSNLLS